MFDYQKMRVFMKRAGRTTLEKILIIASALLLAVILLFAGGLLSGFFSLKSDRSDNSNEPSREETASADETESRVSESSSGGGNNIDSWLSNLFGNRTTTATTAGASDSALYETSIAETTSEGTGTGAATTGPATTAIITPVGTVSSTAPVNTANMYSSYAIMTAFDPSTGVASFDYFDMLRGEDAIDWLVEQEGYTRTEAEDIVNNFADSEFVYKNINPQLRSANMSIVTIKMMCNLDGSAINDALSIPFHYDQFCSIYNEHPELVTYSSYFYYCTVTGNVITGVEQVYWP